MSQNVTDLQSSVASFEQQISFGSSQYLAPKEPQSCRPQVSAKENDETVLKPKTFCVQPNSPTAQCYATFSETFEIMANICCGECNVDSALENVNTTFDYLSLKAIFHSFILPKLIADGFCKRVGHEGNRLKTEYKHVRHTEFDNPSDGFSGESRLRIFAHAAAKTAERIAASVSQNDTRENGLFSEFHFHFDSIEVPKQLLSDFKKQFYTFLKKCSQSETGNLSNKLSVAIVAKIHHTQIPYERENHEN